MDDDRVSKADGMSSDVLSPEREITPQPPPTSPRIKDLLGRAMMTPGDLTALEVQEMAASVVYFLISLKKT